MNDMPPPSAGKKAFIKSYGCQMNVYDSERMGEILAEAGYGVAVEPEDADLEVLLAPLVDGICAGLMSEAGAPGVADPGANLVQAAHAKGIRVVPMVGPSSILLALMASGLNGQHFAFHDIERHIVQGVKRSRRNILLGLSSHEEATGIGNSVPQGVMVDPGDDIFLTDVPRGNCNVRHQITSAKVRSIRLKYTSPLTNRIRTMPRLGRIVSNEGARWPSRLHRNPSTTPTAGFKL